MTLLLDTNVLLELRLGKPGQSPCVRAWAASISESELFISTVTVMELERRVQLLEARVPPQGQALRRWADGVKQAFRSRMLALDEASAAGAAKVLVRNPTMEVRDAMTAGIALAHGRTVVTRNVRHFAGAGVALIDPWGFAEDGEG